MLMGLSVRGFVWIRGVSTVSWSVAVDVFFGRETRILEESNRKRNLFVNDDVCEAINARVESVVSGKWARWKDASLDFLSDCAKDASVKQEADALKEPLDGSRWGSRRSSLKFPR